MSLAVVRVSNFSYSQFTAMGSIALMAMPIIFTVETTWRLGLVHSPDYGTIEHLSSMFQYVNCAPYIMTV